MADQSEVDIFLDVKAQRDRMRAALVEIRDRHQRHGDRCRDCGQHPRYRRHRDDCHLCEVPHPCPDRQTAERGLATNTEQEQK